MQRHCTLFCSDLVDNSEGHSTKRAMARRQQHTGFATSAALQAVLLRPSGLCSSGFCSRCSWRHRPGVTEVGPAFVTANYLDTSTIEVDWQRPDRRGSFGKVWFGVETASGTDVVVKCPVESEKARSLLNVEEHANTKLARISRKRGDSAEARWAEYLGKIIVPRDAELAKDVGRIGLVWRRAGDGETLEDYLQNNRIPELCQTMKVVNQTGNLRVQLAETMLVELVKLLICLDDAGIVHRDIKPDNIVVDTASPSPLRCIDFGSSCDWGSPFKKGLLTATCDP